MKIRVGTQRLAVVAASVILTLAVVYRVAPQASATPSNQTARSPKARFTEPPGTYGKISPSAHSMVRGMAKPRPGGPSTRAKPNPNDAKDHDHAPQTAPRSSDVHVLPRGHASGSTNASQGPKRVPPPAAARRSPQTLAAYLKAQADSPSPATPSTPSSSSRGSVISAPSASVSSGVRTEQVVGQPPPSSPYYTPEQYQQFIGHAETDTSGDGNPPDTQVAVNPNQLIEMTNSALDVYSLASDQITGSDDDSSLYCFWQVQNASAQTAQICPNNNAYSSAYGFDSISDPKVAFDPGSGRFFATELLYSSSNALNAAVGIAVSPASSAGGTDATGMWTLYIVRYSDNQGPGNYDEPRLGFSDDKVVVTWDDVGYGEEEEVLDKTSVVDGSPTYTYEAPVAAELSIIPAVSESSTTTEFAVYNHKPTGDLVDEDLDVQAITGNPGQLNVSITTTSFGIARTNSPPPENQPGNPSTIDDQGLDDRMLSAVWQNGQLWSVNSDACTPPDDSQHNPSDASSCVRADEVITSGATPSSLAIDSDLAENNSDLYYPAVALDSYGDVDITFSESSPFQAPSAEVYSTDPSSLYDGTVLTYQLGQSTYTEQESGGGQRWGDYSGIAVDPNNPGSVWAAAEYSPPGGASWATVLGQFATASSPSWYADSPSASPDVRDAQVMAYDPASNQFVLFGGCLGARAHVRQVTRGPTTVLHGPNSSPPRPHRPGSMQ